MIGFTTMSRSMNGIKTLSDGISIISDGVAQHENVIYSDFINSEDGKTQMINNKLTTEIIECQNLNADDIMSLEINTDSLKTKNIKVIDSSGNEIFIGDGINQKFTFNGITEYNESLTIINKILNQTQGGYIYQTGTNFNTLKDTKINGFLEIGSNFTQTGGSATLKDLTVDNVNMNTNKGITQNGSGTANTLGNTTVTDLIITGSVTFPSSVVIPGTTTSDDIIMEDDSVITQDITTSTTKFNKFRYTKTLDLDVGGDLTMTEAGTTATLKNTIIQGITTLQGDIEQTAGFTKLNTIECNNITLRTDNDLNITGTGKINQTGTGINTLNAIVLNSNQNITFNGNGILSQPLNGINILSHFRGAGFGIIGGRNNTTYSHYQNIQNNNGLQFQFNRDNSSFYSYLLNNRTGLGGGFRFQRYNGGVYVDEPLVIDDNITFNKDVSIVGKSISASSATLGIITQNEIDCLDNCNINIITKFNNLDYQISNLETTTGGVSNATTGITYNLGTDTTTIDNNLIVSSSKNFNLGSINVNNFITDTNTFITSTSNTLQGIIYTGVDDTTTINNDVVITGDLVVQGMNIKDEIDALETSFTTGTLNTTTLITNTLTSQTINTNNLNISGQINMTNATYPNRYIYDLGGITFCNVLDGSFALNIYNTDNYHWFVSQKSNGIFSFLGNTTNKKLSMMPNVPIDGVYGPTTKAEDVLLLASGDSVGSQSLNLTVWSNTKTGVRIEPTKTTISGGDNKISIDNTDGITVDGIQKLNNSLRLYNGINYTQLNQSGNDLLITNSTNTQPVVNINSSLVNIKANTTIDNNLNVNNNANITYTINNNQALITRQNILSQTSITVKLGSSLGNANNTTGSGTTTRTVFTCTTTPNYNKLITVTIPISVSRMFKNVSTGVGDNYLSDTISNITYIVYKNNEVFQTGSCLTSNPFPNYFFLECTPKTTNMSYENYMTNLRVDFYPNASSNTSDDYRVDCTIHYSYTIANVSNFTNLNYVYFFNTAISTVYFINVDIISTTLQPIISTYSTGTYFETTNTTNYFTGTGELWTNDIVSNSIRNQGNIKTNNLQTNSLNVNGNVVLNNGIAGYNIDGSSNFLSTPIFCSMKSFGRPNTDNYWYLNAGFKVVLYNSNDYVSFITTLDNTYSLVGQIFNLTDAERDRTESFKVYFLNVEITYAYLS